MKRKILAGLLAGALAVSSLAACGSDTQTTEATKATTGEKTEDTTAATEGEGTEEAATEFQVPDNAELTVWVMYSGTVVSDLNDIAGVQKMEELTGVHINWIPINQDEVSTKLGTLIASGEYPDIIYPGSVSYPGGTAVGIEDEVLYADMDTLIKNYMPNYMALLDSNEEARKEATDDSGKMLEVKVIVGTDTEAKSEGTYSGLAYRADLLESLDIDVPTTVDEWHDALVKAKNAGIATPFVLNQNGGSDIALSWGIGTGSMTYMQLDGDKVVLSQYQDGYEGYLDTMKQWYAEDLINPNFTTFHYYLDTPTSVEAGDTLLYSQVLSAFTGGNYAAYRMVSNPDAFLQPITAPALNEGDAPIQNARRVVAKDHIYITTSCKNPELAAYWLDFQYSEIGTYLNWYGVEGETYEIGEDGTPKFLDSIFTQEGISASDYIQKYALDQGNCWLGRHDYEAGDKMTMAQAGGKNQTAESVAIWSEPVTNVYLPEGITLTEEESSEITSELTAIKTLIDEYTINYITGQDVKPFSEFKADLENYGMNKCLEVYQTAYERYLAR